jgi:hypothetical protein
VLKLQRKLVRKAHELYFGCKVGEKRYSLGSEDLLWLMFKTLGQAKQKKNPK